MIDKSSSENERKKIFVWHSVCSVKMGGFFIFGGLGSLGKKTAGGPKTIGTPILNWPVY
jgi:hypothetical protein